MAIVGRMVAAEIVIRRSMVAHVTELNITLEDGSRWGLDGYGYRVKPEPSKYGLPPRYFEPRLVPGTDKPRSPPSKKKDTMPQCKRCQAPIQWQKEGGDFKMLNHPDRTPHACAAPKTCRYCEKPVIWKDHEGKRQCFEPEGTTLHNEVCPNRDQCSHCGQKVRWTKVEGKWLALDPVMTRELHWGLCPRNPEAAKNLVLRLAALEAENDTLRTQVGKFEREIHYRDVELKRLTQKAEGR